MDNNYNNINKNIYNSPNNNSHNNNNNSYNSYNSNNNNHLNYNNNNMNPNENYNYNNMYNNIMYNNDTDSGSSKYHDILINNNNNLKSKRRFKYKVLSFVIAIFFIISISSLVFFIYFSTEQLTFKGFKFIETKCKLNSTRYTSRNETSGSCQMLNEDEWWYPYDKDFYKFNSANGNSQFNFSSSYELLVNNRIDSIDNSDGNNNKSHNSKDTVICYQGIFNVYFNDTENQLLNGDIYGIWSQDLDKVNSYLGLVKGESEQTCFYNKHDNKEIIWIRPPSSLFNILLIVIIGLITLFSFIVFIIICKKAFGPLSKEEERAKLLSNSIYYRYTSDNIYNLENRQ